MVDERDADDALGAAATVINKLLALAKKRGFGREAYSIAIGEEIAQPKKRARGRPKTKDANYKGTLAWRLAKLKLDGQLNHGEQMAYARDVAKRVLEESTGRRASKQDIERRARQIVNDFSAVPTQKLLFAAYYQRRRKAGESPEVISARLEAAAAGDHDAERELEHQIREAAADIFPRGATHDSHK